MSFSFVFFSTFFLYIYYRLNHTSLAPLIIPCSRSICAYCCSSAKAKAQGTPSRNALVLRTQSVLPPNEMVDLANEVSEEMELEILCRDCGGMISLRATILSYNDSSSGRSS